ncbi:hypothetical protein SMALA_5287 [Streptomyces malaysiensis subsp. malaysiensis]|nr:hypothetical protein SMALA_5287 [Streptomyces malaysiensis]
MDAGDEKREGRCRLDAGPARPRTRQSAASAGSGTQRSPSAPAESGPRRTAAASARRSAVLDHRPAFSAPCTAAEAPIGYVPARFTGTAVWITSSPSINGSVCPHLLRPPPPGALKPQSRDHLADLLKCRTSRVGPNLTGSDTSSLVRSGCVRQPSALARTKPEWTGHGGLPISREGMGRARHGAQRREDDSVNPSAPTAHP